jgi:muramidase (phage lysozyme)
MSSLRQKYEQILGQPYARGLLEMIRYGEGTAGPAGYQTMFGGGKFDTSKGWRHPDQVVKSGRYASTAAGAYQFLTPTWQGASKALGLSDMSPRNQDLAALYLADKRGALGVLQKGGKLVDVMDRLAPEWASIPTKGGGSYYGQPVKSVGELAKVYEQGKQKITDVQPAAAPAPKQQQAQQSQGDLASLLLGAFKAGLMGQSFAQPKSLLLNSPLLASSPVADPAMSYATAPRSPYLDAILEASR